MTDQHRTEAPVHDVLRRLGADELLVGRDDVARAIDELRRTTGVREVVPWSPGSSGIPGTPGPGAYEAAQTHVQEARTALAEAESAEARLPALRDELEAARKAASGPRILLGIFAVIVLVVLIGQVL